MNELLDFFRSKNEHVSIFKIDEYDFEKEKLEELSRSNTLFGGKVVVVFNRIFDDKNVSRTILENLDSYVASQNIFIFYEEEIDKEILDLIKEKAKKVQKFDLPPSKGMEAGKFNKREYGGYNPFLICDAVGEKNKKKAWLIFQDALLEGVPAEEIFWKIWWQAKTMLAIKISSETDAKNLEKETGFHPFVIKKNLSFLKNFSFKELDDFSWKLVELYHNARRGLADFEIGLEKILINI